MSTVGDQFIEKIGKPGESSKLGFEFSMEWDQIVLEDLFNEIGAGYFQDKFLYLLGEEVTKLNTCLKHWHFIFDDNIDRKVVGRNAHGSLLIIENESELGTTAPIGYLDVLNCSYSTSPELDFMGLFGNWLPNNRLGNFLDNSIFKSLMANDNLILSKHEIVAIKVPLKLGGEIHLENFQIENIFEYHESIAQVYKNAQ